MTPLRAAAGVAQIAHRTTLSAPGFGFAPRAHSFAPSHCSVPLSRLSGNFRDGIGSLCLEELQRAWERDPSSAGEWISLAVHSSTGSPGQIIQESTQHLQESTKLMVLIRAYNVSGHMMAKVDPLGFEDRPFPDRCYRFPKRNADLDNEFSFSVSGMPGFHFEKINSLAPSICHLDDRVRCDWFWTPGATGGLKQKVIYLPFLIGF